MSHIHMKKNHLPLNYQMKIFIGFTLENQETYDIFIDESIYYPKVYYKKAVRHVKNWEWFVKELELEKCQIKIWFLS